MALRDAFVNIAKNAAASSASGLISSTASGLRSGLGGSSSSSSSSPLQTGYKKQEPGILLYPADVGMNAHQASYILFARHDVMGAKLKPKKKAKTVKPIMKQVGPPGRGHEEIDHEATALARSKATDDATKENALTPGSGGVGKNGASNSLVLSRRNIKKTGTFIGLYMPPSVNVSYSMDYAAAEIGVMGEALYGLFKDYQAGTLSTDSINNAAGTVGTGLQKMGLGIVDKVIPGAKDLFAIESGTIITPRTEMMFRGIGRREFSFTFVFIPKSREESNTVKAIVQEFKVGMTPTFKQAGSTREMTIPDIFSIQYMHINKDNSYLNKIGKCYLKSMNVTYGGDKFITYDDDGDGPPPQRTTIALSFQEIEIIDRDAVEQGY